MFSRAAIKSKSTAPARSIFVITQTSAVLKIVGYFNGLSPRIAAPSRRGPHVTFRFGLRSRGRDAKQYHGLWLDHRGVHRDFDVRHEFFVVSKKVIGREKRHDRVRRFRRHAQQGIKNGGGWFLFLLV